jgi:hypothetical protein
MSLRAQTLQLLGRGNVAAVRAIIYARESSTGRDELAGQFGPVCTRIGALKQLALKSHQNGGGNRAMKAPRRDSPRRGGMAACVRAARPSAAASGTAVL